MSWKTRRTARSSAAGGWRSATTRAPPAAPRTQAPAPPAAPPAGCTSTHAWQRWAFRAGWGRLWGRGVCLHGRCHTLRSSKSGGTAGRRAARASVQPSLPWAPPACLPCSNRLPASPVCPLLCSVVRPQQAGCPELRLRGSGAGGGGVPGGVPGRGGAARPVRALRPAQDAVPAGLRRQWRAARHTLLPQCESGRGALRTRQDGRNRGANRGSDEHRGGGLLLRSQQAWEQGAGAPRSDQRGVHGCLGAHPPRPSSPNACPCLRCRCRSATKTPTASFVTKKTWAPRSARQRARSWLQTATQTPARRAPRPTRRPRKCAASAASSTPASATCRCAHNTHQAYQTHHTHHTHTHTHTTPHMWQWEGGMLALAAGCLWQALGADRVACLPPCRPARLDRSARENAAAEQHERLPCFL